MKKILAFILSGIAIVSLTSCSNIASSSSSISKTTLNVILPKYSESTEKWWEKFESDFESEYSDINLNIEVVPAEDIHDTLSSRISSGKAPNVFVSDAFAEYVNDDLLMPAEEYCPETLKDKFISDYWDLCRTNDKIYALPMAVFTQALFYNKDILSASGLEISDKGWGWTMLGSACSKIQSYNSEITPISFGISKENAHNVFAWSTLSVGGGFQDERGKWALNSDKNVLALSNLFIYGSSGFCKTDLQSLSSQQKDFADGKLAMIIAPGNTCTIASNINYGIAPVPKEADRPSANIASCDKFMVFKDNDFESPSVYLETLSRLFEYFYNVERYSEYMVYETGIPTTIESSKLLMEDAEKFKKDDKQGNSQTFTALEKILEGCQFCPTSDEGWESVKQAASEAVIRSIQGEPAQKVLDELEKNIPQK